jgi:hypothetical protein
MNRIGLTVTCCCALLAIAACSSQAPPPPPAITVSQTLIASTPPPAISTPVPVVHSRSVPGAGRPDPFVALFGPPQAAAPKPAHVSVSAFPKIPTLPGFEAGPGGTIHSVWDGVALTGVVRSGGYTAIIAVNDKSYIVRQGDSVGGRFRVAAIGPDFVTLVTVGSPPAERTFSLGG